MIIFGCETLDNLKALIWAEHNAAMEARKAKDKVALVAHNAKRAKLEAELNTLLNQR